MNYSVKKAEEDCNLNNGTSYVKDKEQIEEEYNNIVKGEGNSENYELFKKIIEAGKLFEEDIDALEEKKKEVNDIVKELQNKIILHEIV